jgi:hypothetical protein
MKYTILYTALFVFTSAVYAHEGVSEAHSDYQNGCWVLDSKKDQGRPGIECPEGVDFPAVNEDPISHSDAQNTSTSYKEMQASKGASLGEKCYVSLTNGRNSFASQQQSLLAATPPQTPQVGALIKQFNEDLSYDRCRNLEVTAVANGGDLNGDGNMAVSQDKRIQCQKVGDFTLDWKSCKSGLDAYNMIVIADAALDLTQKIRTQQQNQQMSQQVAARSAQGDMQNAALDASIQANNSLANMNKEKAAAYMAAVGLLGSKIAGWQGKSDGALGKICSSNPPKSAVPLPPNSVLNPNVKNFLPEKKTCLEALQKVRNSDAVFANESAKAQLVGAFMEYMQKAAAAGMAAKQLSNIAKAVEQVKQGTETNEPSTFDRCVVAPNDPACQTPGSRTPAQEYAGGDFSVDGLGSNMIGGNPLEDTEIKMGDPTALPDKVGDASSPFADKAKDADGILNPAPAASLGSGAANGMQSGAMGGMGGRGGGAGGAALGNDLKGPETPKQNDVKANQVGGAYKFTGGQGFKAVAASKDNNPFSSLFDSKSQGGLEEDRSIASDDIGGKDSGLFMRISKRYGKVQSDKRIEALNLE